MQKPDDSEYTKCKAIGQGNDCTFGPKTQVPPGGNVTCFEVIYQSGGKPVFAKPGTWKLYAEVQLEKTVIRSPAIEITVRKNEKAGDTSDVFRACVSHTLEYPLPARAEEWPILQAVEIAPGCRTSAAVERAAVLTKLVESATPAAVETELKKVEEYCKGKSPVEVEFVRLKAVDILLNKKSNQAAEWVGKLEESVVGFTGLQTRSSELLRKK